MPSKRSAAHAALLVPTLAACALAIASPRTAHAQQAPLPASLVALDSREGRNLLVTSDANDDFFHLANQWVSQQLGSFCGVASTVMVLNALQLPAPAVSAWSPYNAFTQDNVFEGPAGAVLTSRAVSRGGMTLDQLGHFVEAHGGVQVRVVHASDTTLDAFRSIAAQNLREAGNYVLINYDRAGVGQETMGHISPLGAYNASADRFLVMDVARYKYPGVWVRAADLFAAMNTPDRSSGLSRGFVTVQSLPGARPRLGPPAKSRLVSFVVTALAAAFAVGAAVGSGVTLLVKRRKRS
jgi:hypothetical protein